MINPPYEDKVIHTIECVINFYFISGFIQSDHPYSLHIQLLSISVLFNQPNGSLFFFQIYRFHSAIHVIQHTGTGLKSTFEIDIAY